MESAGPIKPPPAEDGGEQLPEEHAEMHQHADHDEAHGAVEGVGIASEETQQQTANPIDGSGMAGQHHVADTGQMEWATGLQSE